MAKLISLMKQMLELQSQNQLLMKQMMLMMENQGERRSLVEDQMEEKKEENVEVEQTKLKCIKLIIVKDVVSSVIEGKCSHAFNVLAEIPGDHVVSVKAMEYNENMKLQYFGKIPYLQLLGKSNGVYTIPAAEKLLNNIDAALGYILPIIAEKINVLNLLEVYKETSAPQLFDELTVRNNFVFSEKRYSFDPGIKMPSKLVTMEGVLAGDNLQVAFMVIVYGFSHLWTELFGNDFKLVFNDRVILGMKKKAHKIADTWIWFTCLLKKLVKGAYELEIRYCSIAKIGYFWEKAIEIDFTFIEEIA